MGILRTLFRRLFARLFLPTSARALLPVGVAAPDFDVLDHTGRRVRLSEFRGRRVVLWFFPKASTPG